MLTKPFKLVASPSTGSVATVNAEPLEALNDEQLLDRFLDRDDESAVSEALSG